MKLERRPRFMRRGYERAWWLFVAGVLAAVVWVIVQGLAWPVWMKVILALLAALTPLVSGALWARARQNSTWARLAERRVAVLGKRRWLPTVRGVSLDQLHVHPAHVEVPYITRDQEKKLAEVVGPRKAVLVVGHSLSGKTRLAAEVIRSTFPEAPLLLAESGKALRELFDGGLNPAGIIIWLDNLERFLGADGLNMSLLNRLTTGGAILVATIKGKELERYRPRAEQRPPEWEVIQQFSAISLQRRLTSAEHERVRASVNDPDVLAAVDHYGLAEYLGAGPQALKLFEAGERVNPIGRALVQGAIDWRRTGLIQPVPKHTLLTMLPIYLAGQSDTPRSDQAIDDGLAWATTKISETVALLGQGFTSANEPVYEAFGYLVDQTSRSIPDPIWSFALEQARPVEMLRIALAACQAGNLASAEAALRKAAAENSPEVALSAMLNLVQEDRNNSVVE
jgi:hypothetical protein